MMDCKISDIYEHRTQHPQYFMGIRLQQSWTTLWMLEDILNKEQDIKVFVELGSGYGALSLFAGLQMYMRGHVYSYDIEYLLTMRHRMLAHLLPIDFHQYDILTPEAITHVSQKISSSRCLIFCDAGERDIRSKQFHIYAALLKPRDIIMIHDYQNSITLEDILDITTLEPYRQEDFDSLHTYILSRIKKIERLKQQT